MYARSTTIEAQPSLIDTGIAHVRDVVMPRLVEIDGCVGMSLLVDRESGRCIATSAWQTREAMHASAEQVRPVRDRAAQAFGGSPTVDEWEIAVLHRDHRSGRARACGRPGSRCAPTSSTGPSRSTGNRCCPTSRSSRGSAAPA
ncbi:hypothetical protein I552_5570 [Mycobacterium xenopi 3993]|nr:hypothetical protein I552_5570 [Mycobacterium xenopi 3993]